MSLTSRSNRIWVLICWTSFEGWTMDKGRFGHWGHQAFQLDYYGCGSAIPNQDTSCPVSKWQCVPHWDSSCHTGWFVHKCCAHRLKPPMNWKKKVWWYAIDYLYTNIFYFTVSSIQCWWFWPDWVQCWLWDSPPLAPTASKINWGKHELCTVPFASVIACFDPVFPLAGGYSAGWLPKNIFLGFKVYHEVCEHQIIKSGCVNILLVF